MNNAEQMKRERDELFQNLYHLKKPKRVPITIKVNNEFGIQYAGMDLIDTQWHPEKMEAAANKICEDFFADKNPFGSRRFPAFYTFTDSTYFKIASSGFLQHPEIAPMDPSEYPELIRNPYDFLIEKILPRLYKAFDTSAFTGSLSFAMSMKAKEDDDGAAGAIGRRISQRFGYFNPDAKSAIFAPFDFIADILRGFTGMLTDLRRYGSQVEEACEAVLPLMVKLGITDKPTAMSECYIPLHMAPYMKTKDFEKYYWPTFKRMIEEIMASGQGISLFCEQDWTRYLDYLADLPKGLRIRFEYGDPRQIKDKIGHKHILSGLYPSAFFTTETKSVCLDKAKELLDILAPGGNCTFDVDKVMATYDGGGENIIAVLDFVREYGKY